MSKDFLRQKARLISKMERGDMAEAARIAGVKRPTFQEWLLSQSVKGAEVEKRNLLALKQAVEKRSQILAEAVLESLAA